MGTPHGARLGVRPLPRLFRDYVVCLPCLAPTVRGWGSPHGRRGAIGGPASFDTGSLANLLAAFYGAGGVLAAALLAEFFIRARRRANR